MYVDDILKLNEWMHICASVESSGEMHVFVNGAEKKCTSGNACDVVSGKGINGLIPRRVLRTKAYIGRSNWDNDAYFNGSISDLTVIDGHALTTEEEAATIKINAAAYDRPRTAYCGAVESLNDCIWPWPSHGVKRGALTCKRNSSTPAVFGSGLENVFSNTTTTTNNNYNGTFFFKKRYVYILFSP